MKDKKIDKEVEEDADTFLRNAKKKAHEIYNIASMPVIADDSGLCVNALNGFPGVMTHRFLGENATDKDRNEYIINEVKNVMTRVLKLYVNLFTIMEKIQ